MRKRVSQVNARGRIILGRGMLLRHDDDMRYFVHVHVDNGMKREGERACLCMCDGGALGA